MKSRDIFACVSFLILVCLIAYFFVMATKEIQKFKFSMLTKFVTDAVSLQYREHEYVVFMINGEILSPTHDAACKKCTGLNIQLGE